MDFLLGVLGGMGPEAAVEFLRRLIALTPAQRDQDHIPALLVNDPRIPDRTTCISGGGESPLPALEDAAGILERAGCNLIVMPCNTAHSWLPELRRRVRVPFLDIVACTVEEALQAAPDKTVAVMASSGTIASGLYQDLLNRKNAPFILPSPGQQKAVMDVIYSVKKEGATNPLTERLESIIGELVQRGAGVVLAGCTELPLVLPAASPVPLVDSLSAPARRVVLMLKEKGVLK